MTTLQYPLVRASTTCVLCGRIKGNGLLLCWPCNHDQKDKHDGAYSADTMRRLAAQERALTLDGQRT